MTRSPMPRDAVRALASSEIRDVANSAMGREGVLPFWFGESDSATSEPVRAAAAQSMAAGETFYAQNLGRPYLREALARYASDLHGTVITADRIGVMSSGVTAISMACQLLLSPGDRVVAITPLWPNLTEAPRILGASVDRFPLSVVDGKWTLDVEGLLATLTPGTRMLIVNSPNNPTGWTITAPQITAILEHCRKHGIWVLADDVYERLVHDPALNAAPGFLDQSDPDDLLISVNSFSKAWSMTGWRLGWLTVPASLSDDLAKLIEYNFSCVFEPIQRAGLTALTTGEPEIAAMRARLLHTRQLLVSGLSDIPGVEIPEAGGAMYVFFKLAGGADSVTMAKRLVAEAGLGLAPGSAFGPEGQGWLRWCHAVSDDALLCDGIDRLARFMSKA